MRVVDLHNDFLTELAAGQAKKYVARQAKFVRGLHCAVWTSKMGQESSINKVEEGFSLLEELREKEGQDMDLRLAIEDLHFISKQNLARVINVHPSYCTLTWNSDNALAGGALESGDLTELGVDVVRELEENHIFVDTAHLNERSFMSFSMVTSQPMLCSHTAARGLVDHKRNLKDYQIKMIVESGGLMGLALVSDFLCYERHSTIEDVARHIDYVVSRYGDSSLCLGTDFYGTKNTPKGVKTYSNLNLLEERLRALGYSEESIEKIFYKNAERFFKQTR